MSKKTAASFGLVLLILGVSLWTYLNVRPKGIDVGPYEMVGGAAGEETARLLHNAGKVVLVDADFGIYKLLAPTTEAQIRAFKKAIAKTRIKAVAVEKVPIARPSMGRNGIFMQPGQIGGVLGRHSDADAIVLFVGLAGLQELNALSGKATPKLVLVANYEPYVKSLVEKGVIGLAIAPRYGVDSDQDAKVRSRRELFDRHYQVLVANQIARP